VMGPEGAVNIAFRKQIEASSEPDKTRAELVEGFRELINPYVPAARTYVDDVIDPRQTRAVIIRAIKTARRTRKQLPPRRHAIMPV
jgi:acetyl-CoA carboxylase carboxyltransferase component